MSDSMPEDGKPENSKPRSVTEKAKALAERHKGKLIAAGSVLIAVGAVVTKTTLEQLAQRDEDTEDAPVADAEDFTEVKETESDSASGKPRSSPVEHGVKKHTRTLRDGRVIEIPPYRRGARNDDEASGEAAA
ncbi:hypothetical protein [Streptomyces sp. ITFR-16]|uniref:hypothetical protein n=1 Tax=Streptomyces sp. ITFR-16 TaxID=3075198 RepID=UPI00288C1BD8|nr:hypothetical protein [Streptomyces sp. ITFR-16]WNI27153.1 hypothetical protein RLT58_16920 [Streptomyces sp. ITFR-16]